MEPVLRLVIQLSKSCSETRHTKLLIGMLTRARAASFVFAPSRPVDHPLFIGSVSGPFKIFLLYDCPIWLADHKSMNRSKVTLVILNQRRGCRG